MATTTTTQEILTIMNTILLIFLITMYMTDKSTLTKERAAFSIMCIKIKDPNPVTFNSILRCLGPPIDETTN
jgi:hypothetical protein